MTFCMYWIRMWLWMRSACSTNRCLWAAATGIYIYNAVGAGCSLACCCSLEVVCLVLLGGWCRPTVCWRPLLARAFWAGVWTPAVAADVGVLAWEVVAAWPLYGIEEPMATACYLVLCGVRRGGPCLISGWLLLLVGAR